MIEKLLFGYISFMSLLGMAFCPRRHKRARMRESMHRTRLDGLRQGIPVVTVLVSHILCLKMNQHQYNISPQSVRELARRCG